MDAQGRSSRPLWRTIYESRGETSRFIRAEIDEDGDLMLVGQDVGKDAREFWGDEDYEYWVHVPAAEKDQLLLALMARLYSGNGSAVSDFRTLAQSEGIRSEFGSWV